MRDIMELEQSTVSDHHDDVSEDGSSMPQVHLQWPCDNSIERQIQDAMKDLILDDATLRKFMDVMLADMEKGLSKQYEDAVLKMLPSYVRAVPNGTENGNFFALDLGGTNFRVLLIKLRGKKSDMSSKIYRVPHDIMVGPGDQLFDHIAACMAEFIKQEGLEGQKLPLGFTFSFPCSQHGLTSGKLIHWTKGFKCGGVEGEDVVKLLQDAVNRRGDINMDVVALLNDTVGTLMACAHSENTCNLGVIVGTGTNACYMEKISRIPKMELDDMDPDQVTTSVDLQYDEMIINTEWCAFGSDGALDFILTPFDREVDKHTINPGVHIFEKMVSGMYMGEIVRLALEQLTRDGLLFGGEGSDALFERGQFSTKFLSEIESDLLEEDRTFSRTFNILEDLGLEGITAQDCANVAYVCSLVSTRAAHLCAAGIALLLNRMRKEFCTVGIDGSVYRFHPTFKHLLRQKTVQLADKDLKFKLMLSEDGSGRGAALVAAVACRLEQEKLEHTRKKMEQLSMQQNGPKLVHS